ncbi:uncharacterized protein TRAVEDRAFT_161227 [Trametes versicolor FP-101664 SS1]|uniref:uncharacterized protein n=1 Tax=Trametes versicolor (strain FP-101664) TaxID=717944 RepID=UPI0004623F90|nr:uncharacterized protein TRAVEDRAFT_161227 [Trametes versicolor FP-101664 SS1]EIW63120.1 hypothetical protein TRAVEDRAFT_161227 [Trametes versicolor FP-101664 SS1]
MSSEQSAPYSSSMAAEPSAPYPRPRGLNSASNPPASFTSGLLAGLTVRIEIEETQKADLGRKYARKDKRPLDPPPVVICSFTNVTSHDAPGFQHPLPIETATYGAVCHVDLFPVPPDYQDYVPAKASSSWPLPSVSLPLQRLTDGILPSTHGASSSSLPPPSAIMQGLLPPMPVPEGYVPFQPATTGRYPEGPSSQYSSPMVAGHGQGSMLPGSEKCSHMLAGATFVQAEIVDYNGKKEAMFVFSDLAVKVEGTFVLRYRTMNLTSQTGTSRPFRVLAECFGGSFKVYSTKEFPGLPPSTALTKLLSMYGIRVNMRENERKRRTKSEIDAEAERGEALAPAPARLGGTTLELATLHGAGPSSPTRAAQYSPTSTTSVASSSASGPYARTRGRGMSRGSAHGMYLDDRDADY